MDKQASLKEDSTVTIEKKPGCLVEAVVTLGEKSSKLAQQQAVKNVRKQASLPGFRKGHLPEALVLQHFAKSVEQEYHQTGAEFCFRAIDQHHNNAVRILDNRSIKPTLLKIGPTECSFRFEIQCHPDTPVIVEKEFHAKAPAVPSHVSAEELEKVLKETRHAYATFEPGESRPVALGDTISISLYQLSGEPGEEALPEPKTLTEKMEWSVPAASQDSEDASAFDKWLLPLVLGKEPGATVEAPFLTDEKIKAPPMMVRIKIEGQLNEKEPSDEELCSKTRTGSIEELRQNLEKRLLGTKQREVKSAFKIQLVQELLSKYSFELPQKLFEKFRRSGISRRIALLSEQGVGQAELRSQEEEIQKHATQEANERLRVFYLAKDYLQSHQPDALTVTKQDLEQAAFMDSIVPAANKLLFRGMNEEDMVDSLMVAQITDRFLNALAERISKH
jgi:trigger factor